MEKRIEVQIKAHLNEKDLLKAVAKIFLDGENLLTENPVFNKSYLLSKFSDVGGLTEDNLVEYLVGYYFRSVTGDISTGCNYEVTDKTEEFDSVNWVDVTDNFSVIFAREGYRILEISDVHSPKYIAVKGDASKAIAFMDSADVASVNFFGRYADDGTLLEVFDTIDSAIEYQLTQSDIAMMDREGDEQMVVFIPSYEDWGNDPNFKITVDVASGDLVVNWI